MQHSSTHSFPTFEKIKNSGYSLYYYNIMKLNLGLVLGLAVGPLASVAQENTVAGQSNVEVDASGAGTLAVGEISAAPMCGVKFAQYEERCGPQGGNKVCASGLCCSSIGYCNSTAAHCGKHMGKHCQDKFGACFCTGANNGERCGKQGNNKVCADGLCCSSIGYCGRTSDHCGKYQGGNCQVNFGNCN